MAGGISVGAADVTRAVGVAATLAEGAGVAEAIGLPLGTETGVELANGAHAAITNVATIAVATERDHSYIFNLTRRGKRCGERDSGYWEAGYRWITSHRQK